MEIAPPGIRPASRTGPASRWPAPQGTAGPAGCQQCQSSAASSGGRLGGRAARVGRGRGVQAACLGGNSGVDRSPSEQTHRKAHSHGDHAAEARVAGCAGGHQARLAHRVQVACGTGGERRMPACRQALQLGTAAGHGAAALDGDWDCAGGTGKLHACPPLKPLPSSVSCTRCGASWLKLLGRLPRSRLLAKRSHLRRKVDGRGKPARGGAHN